MADPMDKATGGGAGLVDEFEIPTEPSGGPPVLGGLGIGNKPTSIRVRIMANGDIQYWSVREGEEPKRVVPTPQELAYVKEIVASRKEAAAPDKATPTPAGRLEDITDPNTGRTIKKRDPATGTVIDLPDPPAPKAPEPTVRTGRMATIGPEGQQAPEVVTKTQADYDRQVAGDQRQAAQDLQARLQAAEANALAQARARIEQEKWTADQANTEYNKALDKIRLEAQAEVNALTRRSQDITVRGQDVSAGVAQRGQDLSFQGGLVSNAADLEKALIPGFAQPEQWQAIRQGINDTRRIGGQAPLPDFRGGPPPYDPMQFTQQAAQMALQQTPSPYTLPGAPPQVPPGQYQLPG